MTQTVSTFDQPTGPPGDREPAAGGADLRRLLAALTAVRGGDFGVRLDPAAEAAGSTDGRAEVLGEIAVVFNDVVERNRLLCDEIVRVRQVVGRQGRLDERLRPAGAGAWAAAIEAA